MLLDDVDHAWLASDDKDLLFDAEMLIQFYVELRHRVPLALAA